MKNIKTLSNSELVKVYKEAKVNFRNATEGTPEEIELDKIYTELFNELNERDLDLRDYTETKETIESQITKTNSNNTIKKVKTFVKSLVIATTILLSTSIPVMADTTQPIQDSNIINHYTDSKGNVVTQYKDGSYYINSNVNIYSIDKLNDTITINKDGELYSFYVDKDSIDNYYLAESINITMNNKNEIIDCTVDSEPVVYKNVSIIYSDDEVCCVRIGTNVYDFENEEGLDGWQVNDKCNVIIQDDIVLEVRPVPLCER